VSAGVYGYPPEGAASVTIKTILDYLKERSSLDRVIPSLSSERDYGVFNKTFGDLID